MSVMSNPTENLENHSLYIPSIASPSAYPCQSISQSASQSVIVSDFENIMCLPRSFVWLIHSFSFFLSLHVFFYNFPDSHLVSEVCSCDKERSDCGVYVFSSSSPSSRLHHRCRKAQTFYCVRILKTILFIVCVLIKQSKNYYFCIL